MIMTGLWLLALGAAIIGEGFGMPIAPLWQFGIGGGLVGFAASIVDVGVKRAIEKASVETVIAIAKAEREST